MTDTANSNRFKEVHDMFPQLDTKLSGLITICNDAIKEISVDIETK